MTNFKIVLLGIRVNSATWDNAIEVDGKGDEIQIRTDVRIIDRTGNVLFPTPRRSKIMGDINGYGTRIKAGSRSSNGGIQTGDDIPYPNPYNLQAPPGPDTFPMTIFEGEITEDQGVVIIPSIWEWDGPMDLFNSWGNHIVDSTGEIVSRGVNILNAVKSGGVPTDAQLRYSDFLKTNIDAGLKALKDFLSNILGQAMDRPIGLKEEGDKAVYSPTVIMLPLQIAEMVVNKNFGLGNGHFEISYTDSPRLGGDYTLYVRVERIGGSTPPSHPPRLDYVLPWVRTVYYHLLNVQPSKQTVDSLVGEIHRGTRNPRQVIFGLLTSQDYGVTYGRYLYNHFLDREPEPGAAEARGRQVSDNIAYQQLILGFCDSPEFKSKHPVPQEFVKSLTRKILEREPDEGFSHWVGMIEQGMSTADVIISFLRSEEFGNLTANKYFVKFLGRPHPPSSQSPHTSKIMKGIAIQEVIADILESQEYIENVTRRSMQT